MKKKITFLILLLLCSIFASAQQTGQIRGKVIDDNGEPLVGAAIILPKLMIGAYTNDEGIFSVDKIPAGNNLIQALAYASTTDRYDYAYWNGTTWSALQTIETDAAAGATPFKEPFMIAPKNPFQPIKHP